MIIPEWVTAIATVISIPISIWAIVSTKNNKKNIKQVANKLGIQMKGNTVIGSGTMVHIGEKKEK